MKRKNIIRFIYQVNHSGDSMKEILEGNFFFLLRKQFGERHKLHETLKTIEDLLIAH